MDFQGYLFLCSNGWLTYETYESELQEAVEQQLFPKVPVPVQHMAIFYHLGTEPDRNLPIQSCVQHSTGKVSKPMTVKRMDRCS